MLLSCLRGYNYEKNFRWLFFQFPLLAFTHQKFFFLFCNFQYYFLDMKVLPIYEMTIYNAFLVFIIFSVIGWISEVIFVGLFVEHKFVNRGFLHGPLCPIYGFGELVILLLPSRLYSTWIPLFLASMVLCTVVEYLSSWILEKLFHTLW